MPSCRQTVGKFKNELTVSDDELGGLAELVDIALLVDLVGLLVVDEQVGGTLAIHPLVVDGFVRFCLERLLQENSN